MAHDGDTHSTVEFLDLGDSRDSGDGPRPRPTRRRRPAPLLLLLGIVVAVAATTVWHGSGRPPHQAPAATRTPPAAAGSSPASSPGPGAAETAAPASIPAVVVTQAGRLLGVTAPWELFGRGDGVLVRIQPATGRVTRTTVPPLQSSGWVSLVAGGHQVVIRPIDYVPGYLVPDGQPARPLPPVLGRGGPVFPGPDPGHLWVQPRADPVMRLTGFDGRPTRLSIPIPPDMNVLAARPDGTGYLLFGGVGGVYDARPGAFQRITTGSLVAVGPTRWLAAECDNSHRCTTVVINRRDGSRHVLVDRSGHPIDLGISEAAAGWTGAISPDGSTAAVFGMSHGLPTLSLLDLASGRLDRLDLQLSPSGPPDDTVWSPDSRWLFTIAENGTLLAVDPHTARIRDLGIPLPSVTQLALRP